MFLLSCIGTHRSLTPSPIPPRRSCKPLQPPSLRRKPQAPQTQSQHTAQSAHPPGSLQEHDKAAPGRLVPHRPASAPRPRNENRLGRDSLDAQCDSPPLPPGPVHHPGRHRDRLTRPQRDDGAIHQLDHQHSLDDQE